MNQLFEMLLSRGYSPTNKAHGRIGFDDVLEAIKSPGSHYLINTLPITEQDCLIHNTLPCDKEEELINTLLESYEINTKKIILYGKNGCDNTVYAKYDQLTKLGIAGVHIYVGGLFEWLLLRDVYGSALFKLKGSTDDILKYRPPLY